jgi:hypothetical protein
MFQIGDKVRVTRKMSPIAPGVQSMYHGATGVIVAKDGVTEWCTVHVTDAPEPTKGILGDDHQAYFKESELVSA